MRLGDYNVRQGSVIRLLRRPRTSPVSYIGSQVSQQQPPSADQAKTEEERRTEVEALLNQRPPPIKRIAASKISEPIKPASVVKTPSESTVEPSETPKPQKIMPTPVTTNGNASVKAASVVSKMESLRLELPDTEAYRNFREALGSQMLAKKGADSDSD